MRQDTHTRFEWIFWFLTNSNEQKSNLQKFTIRLKCTVRFVIELTLSNSIYRVCTWCRCNRRIFPSTLREWFEENELRVECCCSALRELSCVSFYPSFRETSSRIAIGRPLVVNIGASNSK